MRIVHLSDLHLGFRQFTRQTKTGRNQREQDVSNTFFQAVSQIVDLKPDLILVAGDVFHMVRPSNPAILDALAGFAKLAKVAPTVVISGNHEDKKNTETECILPSLRSVGCMVLWDQTGRGWPTPKIAVSCVPERFAGELEYTPGDFLLLHGEVQGVMSIDTPHSIPRERIKADTYQYVALGHYHVRSDIWPNGGYSGSLDYVSTDIWTEARSGVPKGFIEYDTETKVRTFHPVQTRGVFDLPVIDAADWTFPKIEAALVAVAEFAGLPDGSIVRQRVINLTRSEWRGQSNKAIRNASKRLFVFQVTPTFRVEPSRKTPQERKATLEDDLIAFLKKRELPADVSLDKLMETGLQYFRAAVPEVEPVTE